MGTGLADNVSQGGAGGDQFRTAPLWGLGQRIFFLHDGRTNNLVTVVNAHGSTWIGSKRLAQRRRCSELDRPAEPDQFPALAVNRN